MSKEKQRQAYHASRAMSAFGELRWHLQQACAEEELKTLEGFDAITLAQQRLGQLTPKERSEVESADRCAGGHGRPATPFGNRFDK